MKRIVYMNGGALCVATPVINTYPAPENITEDEAVARAMAKIPATATDVRVLPETAIPASREHRALWTYSPDKTAVIVDSAPAAAADAEKSRLADVEQAIATDAQVAALKAMSNAEFSAWFAANVTTLAQARNVLERLARIVIRRVL